MTSKQTESVRNLAFNKNQHKSSGFFRRLGQRAGWAAKREIYAQIGLMSILATVVVLLSFPSSTADFKVGELAPYTIRADRGFKVIDQVSTEASKLEAASQVSPVFLLDDITPELLQNEVETIFSNGRAALSYNRAHKAMMDSWNLIRLDDMEDSFYKVFHVEKSSMAWENLVQSRFNADLEKEIQNIILELMGPGLSEKLPDDYDRWRKPVTLLSMSKKTEFTLPSAMMIMTMENARRHINIKARLLRTRLNPIEINLLVELSESLIKPNLSYDEDETQRRIDRAMALVPDTYIEVRAGEVIVREGSIISPYDEAKIKALRYGAETYNKVFNFLGLFIILFVFLNVVQGLMQPTRRGVFHRMAVRDQLFITTLLLGAALITYGAGRLGSNISWELDFINGNTLFYAIPFSAATMLTSIFLGTNRAAFMALFVAIVVVLVAPTGKFAVFLYAYNGSLASLWCLRNMRERRKLIPASFWAMLVNCLTLLGITLLLDAQWGFHTIYNFGAALISGFFSGIIAIGMIPVIEAVFGLNTNLKILELGSLDRPILRELMLSAPGTYHHSVIVGAMVEAAAETIGANPHLAKVGAYYHDIGKLKKPLYFVENQTGENRHDTLSPSMSALVLIGHVKEGVEMAIADKLPRSIVDIIEQHHGTSLMGFFFHKAKEQRQEDQPEINEGDFRYPGPKPRSKEAGLVMMGDICEAATRSLAEPTPIKIKNMVRHLVNQIFSDGQLDDCRISTKEIAEVVNTFTTILIGIYHHRVAYPGSKKFDKKTDEQLSGSSNKNEALKLENSRAVH